MGYAKEKQKKEYTWPEAWEKKRKEEKRKIAHISK